MNAIVAPLADASTSDAIGWCPNFERIRREAGLARTGQPGDPSALVETDCWLTLIDAELSAQSTRANEPARAEVIKWRTELLGLRAALEKHNGGATEVSGPRRNEDGTRTRLPFASPRQPSWAAANHQPSNGERFNEISTAA